MYIYRTPRYSYYKPYTFLSFLFDCFMVLISSGLWLIWIFVREMRRRDRQW